MVANSINSLELITIIIINYLLLSHWQYHNFFENVVTDEAECNLGNIRTKPMQQFHLWYLGGSREVCKGTAMCFDSSAFSLVYFVSLPPIFRMSIVHSANWFKCSMTCWQVPGSWAVDRSPLWPPCCWGQGFLLHYYLSSTSLLNNRSSVLNWNPRI